ncbi:hypothetical protein L7F22_037492 [Adiantum nelumboides]|nr:hypothetical protein [Adiantum nelumboides]
MAFGQGDDPFCCLFFGQLLPPLFPQVSLPNSSANLRMPSISAQYAVPLAVSRRSLVSSRRPAGCFRVCAANEGITRTWKEPQFRVAQGHGVQGKWKLAHSFDLLIDRLRASREKQIAPSHQPGQGRAGGQLTPSQQQRMPRQQPTLSLIMLRARRSRQPEMPSPPLIVASTPPPIRRRMPPVMPSPASRTRSTVLS